MSDWVTVTTQKELDAAIAAKQMRVEIAAAVTLEARVPADGFTLFLKAVSGAWLRLLSGKVVACGSSHVEARGSSHVEACGSSHVVAMGSSHVVAWGASHVVARDSSHVVAMGSSHVVARGSSHVVARDSSHVEAWGASHVEACGSSHVVARGSSHVVAMGSSHVEARGAASLSLFGCFIKARATASVAVQLHNDAKCDGGTQIKIVQPKTAREWCEWYGAEIFGDYAILFKGVNESFQSARGATYVPGTLTVADDWDGGDQECGKGLHFSPTAACTKQFATDAKKFVACAVRLDGLAVHPDGDHPNKVKAEKCWNLYECDIYGKQIGERFEVQQNKPAKKTANSQRPGGVIASPPLGLLVLQRTTR